MSLGNACLLFKGLLSTVLFTRFCFLSCVSYKMGVGKGEGAKREILASMSITFRGKPDIAGLGFAGAELGEQDKDKNMATVSSQWIRERVQTCKQKTAVLQGKALSGKWKAPSIAEVKASCKCLNVLPALFLLNCCPVQLCYLL